MQRAAAAVLLLLAGATAASAQTTGVFNRTGSGARAAGMANAFVAVSDDGTAASWNPAGLGQLRNIELSAVTTLSSRGLSASGFRAVDDLSMFTPYRSRYGNAYLDFASLAVPFRLAGRPFTVQASWRSQYDLDYHEAGSSTRIPVSPLAPPGVVVNSNGDSAGSIDIASLAAAAKLTPRFALGASLNVWRGYWTEQIWTSESPLDGSASSLFTSSAQSTRMRGHAFSGGALFTYPRFSLGLVYQRPLHGDFDATFEGHTSDVPDPASATLDARLHLPQAFGGGVAWHPAPRWTVAADLTWDQWTETLVQAEGREAINLFDGLPRTLSATRDTVSANVGAEWLQHGEGFVVPVRFGFGFEPQGARDPYTRDPVDFRLLAVGTGYNTNWLKFDAAVQYRWARFRDGTSFSARNVDELTPVAIGDRGVREWRVKLSLILRVTDEDKLDRALKKVFGGEPAPAQ